MLGIDLISDIATDIEQKGLLQYGVVLWASTNKHYLLLTPPYAMTDEQFERVADALRSCQAWRLWQRVLLARAANTGSI
ncbi:hypothetical protein FOFC_17400 [Fusarium oxysporum]|nr:hypothetical protein FOFC_17400 [Fusarium oxysporum]